MAIAIVPILCTARAREPKNNPANASKAIQETGHSALFFASALRTTTIAAMSPIALIPKSKAAVSASQAWKETGLYATSAVIPYLLVTSFPLATLSKELVNAMKNENMLPTDWRVDFRKHKLPP